MYWTYLTMFLFLAKMNKNIIIILVTNYHYNKHLIFTDYNTHKNKKHTLKR